jgi:hypothetical protein
MGAGALLGASFALLMVPHARSTAIAHLILALGRQPEWLRSAWAGPRQGLERGLRRAIAQAPDDRDLQVGAAMFPVVSTLDDMRADSAVPPPGVVVPSIVQRLQALNHRYPDNAAIRAHLLRYLSIRDVRIPHPRGASIGGHKLPVGLGVGVPPPSRAAAETFKTAAREGAQLEPENGYFVAMQAAGAFAAGQDEEALAFLHESAQKPFWDDLTADELHAKWKLLEAAYGAQGSMLKAHKAFHLQFSHFSLIQETAWMAVWYAVKNEQAGETKRAIQIRHDLLQLAVRIGDSPPLDANRRLGFSVFQIGGAGLAPSPFLYPVPSSDLPGYRYLTAPYEAYLRAHGQETESEWVRLQGERVGRQQEQMSSTSLSMLGTLSSQRLGAWWFFDILLVRMVFSLLVLWGASVLAAGRRRASAGEGQATSPAVWMLLSGALLVAPSVWLLGLQDWRAVRDQLDFNPAVLLALAVCVIGSLAPLSIRLIAPDGFGESLRKPLGWIRAGMLWVFAPLTLVDVLGADPTVMISVALGVALSGFLWLSQRAGRPDNRPSPRPRWKPAVVAAIALLPALLFALPVHDRILVDMDTLQEAFQGAADYAPMRSALLLVALLPALSLIFMQLCRVAALRQSLRAGMTRGLRQTAPWAAAFLLAAYIAALVPTIQTDRALDYQLELLLRSGSNGVLMSR